MKNYSKLGEKLNMPAIKVKVVKSCEQVQAFTKKFGVRNRQEAQQTPGGGGGGGGYSIFSAYVGSDPASTVHPPKNIRNFKHPKKIFEIFTTQKNIPILYIYLKKRP